MRVRNLLARRSRNKTCEVRKEYVIVDIIQIPPGQVQVLRVTRPSRYALRVCDARLVSALVAPWPLWSLVSHILAY